jgi:hypothetical protein
MNANQRFCFCRFKRRFIFIPKLEDAMSGGGQLVCIFEQYTKQKIIETEIVQKLANTIYFPPFLMDKRDEVSKVERNFEEKVFHISANPPPDPRYGVKLTISDDSQELRKVSLREL